MSTYCQKNIKGGVEIEVQKIDCSCYKKNKNVLVKVTEMGNVTEIQYMEKRNNKQTIKMLDKDNYMILKTGEVLPCNHIESRADGKKSLYRTFANARALINTNVTDVSCVRWCTLTYAENMMDTKQLYDDFKKFNMRFQYYLQKNNISSAEYIVMMEPQGRGAWHCHLLYIWDKFKAPYIPNSVFSDLWSNGFVTIKKLDKVDNVGAYLTAYLGDMDMQDYLQSGNVKIKRGGIVVSGVKEVEIDGIKKYYVKGARLGMYPTNFNMIRYSRGIKKPNIEMLTQEMAEKKVLGATKTFSSSIKLSDGEFENIIIKDYYNSLRKV